MHKSVKKRGMEAKNPAVIFQQSEIKRSIKNITKNENQKVNKSFTK